MRRRIPPAANGRFQLTGQSIYRRGLRTMTRPTATLVRFDGLQGQGANAAPLEAHLLVSRASYGKEQEAPRNCGRSNKKRH